MADNMYDSTFKLQVKTHLINKIYNQSERIFQYQINDIVLNNAREIDELAAMADNFVSYINYKGTNYFSRPTLFKDANGRHREIKTHQCTHNRLLPEFETMLRTLLAERGELAEEKLKLTNYVQNVLNELTTITDLYLVFPSSVHRYLPAKDGSEATVDNHRIKFIQTLYGHYQSVISERILTNLLFTEKM